MQRIPFEKLTGLDGGEPSAAIRARVEAARAVQAERFAPLNKPHVLVNGNMGPAIAACEQGETNESNLKVAANSLRQTQGSRAGNGVIAFVHA